MRIPFRKALTQMVHAGRAASFLGFDTLGGFLKRTRVDYAKEVGDGLDASVVTAPLQWIQRSFREGRLTVERPGADGEAETVVGHELARLIANPNPWYSDEYLWDATNASYLLSGNAYWLKVRNGAGRVVELWWAPHWTVTPKWPDDGSEFISHYSYKPGSSARPRRVEREDVVHFRHGVDPANPRLGLSPLRGVLREIFMDLEASNWVAALLRNMGVPGLVLSPEAGVQAAPEDVDATKAYMRQATTGDRRGEIVVMGAATKVERVSFDPKAMDLSVARDVAEERVCACFGVPAAVVGFGAGLQSAKVGATMKELRQLAYRNGVLPLMRSYAGEIKRSLLPDFTPAGRRDADALEVCFDTDGIDALREDRKAEAEAEKLQAERWEILVRAGIASIAEAQEKLELELDPSQALYLRPFSAIEVPIGSGPRELDTPELRALKLQAKATLDQSRRGYVQALELAAPRHAEAFQRKLWPFFKQLGRDAAAAARPILDEQWSPPPVETRGAKVDEITGEDRLLAEAVLQQLELDLVHSTTFTRLYEVHYLEVAKEVSRAGELIGLATSLPDPVARAVTAAGGRRAGLVDLTAQSRKAMFDALAEGRAEGLGVDQLVERISAHVEGGPWQSSEYRARIIARTETKFAQNTSTLARAQHEGVSQFMVFDGRLGPGRSLPSHIARSGSVVDAQTAAEWVATEHPNGTISITPFFDPEADDNEN